MDRHVRFTIAFLAVFLLTFAGMLPPSLCRLLRLLPIPIRKCNGDNTLWSLWS
jgi:hypothetical protein